MDIDAQLLATAERLFDRDGFNATGMGRVIQETGLSSRTVYKHATSKSALMAMVLSERQRRFFEHLDARSTDALFASLTIWVEQEGARGCLFFRAHAETGGNTPVIERAVTAYHSYLHARIAELVALETGATHDDLTDQMLALFEGATTAATYRGIAVIEAARIRAQNFIAEAKQQ
ncbi:TetR/AcrR family transcriptional regulator [Salinisphaera sp. USBA-960]|nr:TetR/AcrR family transcriptional regulator [Salifodinibacter halophilus]NNC26907.1 TetR/AcrR family transcriptional regulator [Salifodinibacter halophilus]